MRKLRFSKFVAAGNDFVIINNIEKKIPPRMYPDLAKKLCAQKFSVGADGFMAVEPSVKSNCEFGMAFYNAEQFPAAYRGDAFVALHGSWNRVPPAGYSVARIRFQDGKPVRMEEFLTGFLTQDGAAHFGRPAGLAVAPDGALLVTDDSNGVLYRLSYE